MVSKKKIAVIGAGAFGGWSALWLQRSGAQVTLVDAWGAGNSRSSSGGETRVIRHAYTDPLYVNMAKRSLELWREHCNRWNMALYQQSGVLFLDRAGDFCELARINLERKDIDHEILSQEQLATRWPQINCSDLRSGLYEPEAGYLLAGRACQAVVNAFVREGGRYRIVQALPGTITDKAMLPVQLHDGSQLEADEYVFACGPWLGYLFPQLGLDLTVTRQELFFFERAAARQAEFSTGLPVWAEVGECFWYGIPGNGKPGFKIADDSRGPVFDPTHGDRTPGTSGLQSAQKYLAHRFPDMAGAQVLDSRVCQYTDTADKHFIIDRHPAAENCWLLGGGSGHGFKHSPAVGEYLSGVMSQKIDEQPEFSLDRD